VGLNSLDFSTPPRPKKRGEKLYSPSCCKQREKKEKADGKDVRVLLYNTPSIPAVARKRGERKNLKKPPRPSRSVLRGEKRNEEEEEKRRTFRCGRILACRQKGRKKWERNSLAANRLPAAGEEEGGRRDAKDASSMSVRAPGHMRGKRSKDEYLDGSFTGEGGKKNCR